MSMFARLVTTIFDGVWGLFSINWPGFDFTFGHVALAGILAHAVLTILLRTTGMSVTGTFKTHGGNNGHIKISKERSDDTK